MALYNTDVSSGFDRLRIMQPNSRSITEQVNDVQINGMKPRISLLLVATAKN